MEFLQLTIDGIAVSVAPGTSVLEAARQAGVKIPTLCHLPELTPFGACRMCIVQVDGLKNLAASCSLPVSDGMAVHTHTPVVLEVRRMILELLLANHPADCFSCDRNLNCELQTLAAELGVKKIRFDGERRRFAIDNNNPFIVRDNEKCILCGRCVRVCQEQQVCNVLEFNGRGFHTKLAPAFDTATNESDCTFCGACVASCQVGALTEKNSVSLVGPIKRYARHVHSAVSVAILT